MKMSHIYQPVVIRELLKNGGRTKSSEIASVIASTDPTQVEYYERILARYPKSTLKKHEIADLNKGIWTLATSDLSADETAELIELCEQKSMTI